MERATSNLPPLQLGRPWRPANHDYKNVDLPNKAELRRVISIS